MRYDDLVLIVAERGAYVCRGVHLGLELQRGVRYLYTDLGGTGRRVQDRVDERDLTRELLAG